MDSLSFAFVIWLVAAARTAGLPPILDGRLRAQTGGNREREGRLRPRVCVAATTHQGERGAGKRSGRGRGSCGGGVERGQPAAAPDHCHHPPERSYTRCGRPIPGNRPRVCGCSPHGRAEVERYGEGRWRGCGGGTAGSQAAAAAAAGLLSLRSSLVALSKHGEKVREISGGYWGHLERGEIGLGSDISVTPHQISKQRTGQTGARQKKASKPGLNQQQKPNTRV